MIPVPFFLVPLALGSGLVFGALIGGVATWWRTAETRRRLADVRIVFNQFDVWYVNFIKGPMKDDDFNNLCSECGGLISRMLRALSGKERK